MPRSSGTDGGQRAVDGDAPVAQHERGRRLAPDEREPAPALAVLDRLEQEAGAVADELGEGRRPASRGRPAAPATPGRRCGSAARAWNSSPAGSDHAHGPEAPEEAGVLAGVAGAVALLLDDEQQRVAVAVVVRRPHPLAVARRLALAPAPPGGCGSRTRCGPLERAGAASRRSSTPSSAPRRCPPPARWRAPGRRRCRCTAASCSGEASIRVPVGMATMVRAGPAKPTRGRARSSPRPARRRRRGCRARGG